MTPERRLFWRGWMRPSAGSAFGASLAEANPVGRRPGTTFGSDDRRSPPHQLRSPKRQATWAAAWCPRVDLPRTEARTVLRCPAMERLPTFVAAIAALCCGRGVLS